MTIERAWLCALTAAIAGLQPRLDISFLSFMGLAGYVAAIVCMFVAAGRIRK